MICMMISSLEMSHFQKFWLVFRYLMKIVLKMCTFKFSVAEASLHSQITVRSSVCHHYPSSFNSTTFQLVIHVFQSLSFKFMSIVLPDQVQYKWNYCVRGKSNLNNFLSEWEPTGREKQIICYHFFNLVINVFNHKANEKGRCWSTIK